MAKLVLNDIVSGYASITALNDNFARIETALENTLSRDGTTPNTMSANLDMNGYLILNQANPVAISGFEWNGDWATATVYAVGDIVYESSTGTAYICVVAHTSGTFATDLAAVKWQVFASASLPPQTAQAAKFLQTNGTSASWQVPKGSEVSNTPTGTVAATTVQGAIDEIVSDLAAPSGSSLVGFIHPGTGAVARTVQSKLREFVSVKDFGAVGNSNGTTGNGTDDTAAFAAAVAYVKATGGAYTLFVPEGVYRLTSQVLIDAAVRIVGDGVSPYAGAIGTVGGGSWLYFDHSGNGLTIDGAAIMSGISLEKFGTLRNQPTPAPAWTPNSHGYDIYVDNADVFIDDLLLLNPTKGVFLTNGNAGRLEINRLRGQAFQTMLRVDTSYDVIKINDLHQWPFWKDDTNVHNYTMDNLDVLFFERTDNPMLTNIFTIFARSGMRFGQNANGKTSKVHLVNADFDRGAFGVWVNASVTSGITGQFVNITHQGETGFAGSKALFVEGNNSTIDMTNFRTNLCNQNGILIAGTGNLIALSGHTMIYNYDQSNGNFPAIEALSDNIVRVDGYPEIAGGLGLGGKYGGAGRIFVDDWRDYTPTVTSETGTITTVGAVSARYKRVGNTIEFQCDVAITTNGTAAGAVRVSLPDTVASNGVAAGREIAVSGKSVTGQLSLNATTCDIRNFDNTYPGADNTRFIVNGSYRIS